MADVGGFSCHVRACNNGKFFTIGAEVGIIGNKSISFVELIQYGVTTVRDMESIGIIDFWSAVIMEAGGFGKGTENIKNG